MEKPTHPPISVGDWHVFMEKLRNFANASWNYYSSDQKDHGVEWVKACAEVDTSFRTILAGIDETYEAYVAENRG